MAHTQRLQAGVVARRLHLARAEAGRQVSHLVERALVAVCRSMRGGGCRKQRQLRAPYPDQAREPRSQNVT
jgi:hypothetical protein